MGTLDHDVAEVSTVMSGSSSQAQAARGSTATARPADRYNERGGPRAGGRWRDQVVAEPLMVPLPHGSAPRTCRARAASAVPRRESGGSDTVTQASPSAGPP